jgi:hypothetical protein
MWVAKLVKFVVTILLEAVDVLTTQVILSQVIGATHFNKQIGFIFYGLKSNDYGATKCPWSKQKPIFTADGAGNLFSALQVRTARLY